jgi:hypothetical protein
MLVPDAAHHRRVELRLNELARRHFSRFPGVYHIDMRHLGALGGGDMVAGEALLHRMFKMAGPRAVHPDAVRELGNGSITRGRRVIDRFLSRLHGDRGADDADEPEAEQQLIPRRDGNHGRCAKGGAVRIEKNDAHYHDCADSGTICSICKMFKEPNGCSLVRGFISRTGSCRHFEKA